MGEPETSEVAQVDQHAQPSSSSYDFLNLATNDVLIISTLRKMGVTMIEKKHRASSPASYHVWRKKFRIGKEVELYYDVGINVDPFFLGHILFCRGFMEVCMRLPLSPLAISIFNYFQRAPIQFTCPSFVVVAVFNCINNHKDLGGGRPNLFEFLYYF